MKALLFRPLLLLLSLLSSLSAQQQPARIASPRIGYVYPAGGRQGTTFQILVGGQYLKDVLDLDFSTKGLKGRVLDYEHPLDQKEIEALREEGAALRAKRKAAGGAGVQPGHLPTRSAPPSCVRAPNTAPTDNPPPRSARSCVWS